RASADGAATRPSRSPGAERWRRRPTLSFAVDTTRAVAAGSRAVPSEPPPRPGRAWERPWAYARAIRPSRCRSCSAVGRARPPAPPQHCRDVAQPAGERLLQRGAHGALPEVELHLQLAAAHDHAAAVRERRLRRRIEDQRRDDVVVGVQLTEELPRPGSGAGE